MAIKKYLASLRCEFSTSKFSSVCVMRQLWSFFFFKLKIVNGNRLMCRVSFYLVGCGIYVS